MWKAVIFDLDGTLVDTLDDLAEAMNEVLAERGFPLRTKNEYRYFVGNGVENLVRRALPEEAKDEETVRIGRELFNGKYAPRSILKSRPYPDVVELVSELGRLGVPLAVATNKPDELAKAIIRRFFPGNPFRAIQGASPSLPHKPDPEIALRLAASIGVEPGETAFVGDSDVDVETARNAGMVSVGAAWGFRGRAELVGAGADIVIDKPLDFLALLQ